MSASERVSADCHPESWPSWLVEVGPGMPASVRVFECVAAEYRDACRDGFTYRHIVNQHLNALADAKAKSPNGAISHAQYAMLVAQNGNVPRLIDTFAAAKRMAILQLIDATRAASHSGSLLVMFGMLRALIEQVAHLDAFVVKMPIREQPTDFAQANQALGSILSHCGSSLYGTRFDWLAILKEGSGALFEAKSREYKAQAHRLDRTAKSIMGAVDGLGKTVPKVRLVYEFLCEFAHPNMGMLLSSTHSAKLVPDARGVPWIEKHLSLGVPALCVKELASEIDVVFAKCAQCLDRSDQLMLQLDAQREKALAIGQVVIRQLLTRDQGVFEPYGVCPCGSGKKVKFCCGRRGRH